MTESPLWSWTLKHVRDAIVDRAVSPVETTQAILDRIETRLRINAYISVAHDTALARARELERELLEGGELGPLHGVAVALKDNIATADQPTTAGSPAFRNPQPARDAVLVQLLRDAGAIIIGKTNLYELAFGAPHPSFGETLNPWNPALTCGGSSNGSAAAVADGQAHASVGTDTGGSIRIPAAFCGVVGIKPSRGLVDPRGIVPVSVDLDVAGPLARTVEDAQLVLEVMAGGLCSSKLAPELDVKTLVVGVPSGQPVFNVDSAIAGAWELAQRKLEAAGLAVKQVVLPDLFLCRDVMWALASVDIAEYHRDTLQLRGHLLSSDVRNNLLLGTVIPAVDYIRAQRVRKEIVAHIVGVFQEIDVLLMPSVAMTPYLTGQGRITVGGIEEGTLKAIMRFTPLANLTGQPAVVVPVTQGVAGEPPLTVQLHGRHFEERTLLSVARLLEGDVHVAAERTSEGESGGSEP